MRIVEVAKEWNISERSVYRLIKRGILPATVKVRDAPLVGYDIKEDLVSMVKAGIQASGEKPTPMSIGEIILLFKEVNKCR